MKRMSDKMKNDGKSNSAQTRLGYESRYWKHLLKDIDNTSAEIYTLCLNSNNIAMCKEMMLKYQHLVYDFNNLLLHIKFKSQGGCLVEPARYNVFSVSIEGDKDAELDILYKYAEVETSITGNKRLNLNRKTSKLGTNILAPSFIPSHSSEGDVSKLADRQIHLCEEGEQSFPSSFHRNNPGLPAFSISPFSSFQPRGLWHLQPHQTYGQLPHYHISSSFIPLPHFPSSTIYPNGLPYSSYPFSSGYQTLMSSNERLAACQDEITERDSSIENNQIQKENTLDRYHTHGANSLPLKSTDERVINLQSKENSNGSSLAGSDNCNLGSVPPGVTHVPAAKLDSLKDEVKQKSTSAIENCQPVLNETTLQEKLNNDDNASSVKILNSQSQFINIDKMIPVVEEQSISNSTLLHENSNLQTLDKNIPIFELPEDERCKQFPELKHDKLFSKKHKIKFPKTKLSKKQKGSVQDSEIRNSESTWYPQTSVSSTPSSQPRVTPNVVLAQSYSLITEKPRVIPSTNSRPQGSVSGQIRPVRKGLSLKREVIKQQNLNHQKFKQQDQLHRDKLKFPLRPYWRESHWSGKRKTPPAVMEDGWQTVRYRSKEYYTNPAPERNICSNSITTVNDKPPFDLLLKNKSNTTIYAQHEIKTQKIRNESLRKEFIQDKKVSHLSKDVNSDSTKRKMLNNLNTNENCTKLLISNDQQNETVEGKLSKKESAALKDLGKHCRGTDNVSLLISSELLSGDSNNHEVWNIHNDDSKQSNPYENELVNKIEAISTQECNNIFQSEETFEQIGCYDDNSFDMDNTIIVDSLVFDDPTLDIPINLDFPDLLATNYNDESFKSYSEEDNSESTGTNSPGNLCFGDLPNENNAKDMYSEFMQYLNCISWAAQIDEIENFGALFNKDSNQSFIDSYTTPSIEHFEQFILNNPDSALQFRREISIKYKQVRETEAKQQQAYEKRQQLLQCKTAKVRELVQKVEEVKAAKYKLALQMKSQIDNKLKKAEENRKLHLSIIKKKAHDEEEKLKEIAFINELEAQNRRHDSLILRQEHEERIQGIIEERQRRVEEKAAKDAAVEERRRILEAERQAKLLEMSEKRKKKEENIDRKQQEKEKERLEIAREKAREREERLLARQAAQLANAEELQKRIQQKQEESARRHEENIELIRQKALEVGLHKNVEEILNPTSCKLEEQKDVAESHHYSYNELKPSFKKRCKKIRSRMTARGIKFIQNYCFSPNFTCMEIATELEELDKLNEISDDTNKYTNMETKLSVLGDLLKTEPLAIQTFVNYKGLISCFKIIKNIITSNSSISPALLIKCLSSCMQLVDKVIEHSDENLKYVVYSNDIATVFDLLHYCFAKQKNERKDWVSLTASVSNLILKLLKHINSYEEKQFADCQEFLSRLPDIVSYFICSGIVHDIIDLLRAVVIDGNTKFSSLVSPSLLLITELLEKKFYSEDMSSLLKATDCLETVYLLYEALQKMAATSSKLLPGCTLPILSMLLQFALADIKLFQSVLGAEGMALQIRSIASTVITFCSKNQIHESYLTAMIQLVGFFAVHNEKNQALLQSGQQPTVLQLLISLPFQYFCDEKYMFYLYPTLLACTHENPVNKAIVESELSYDNLKTFAKTEAARENQLIILFYDQRLLSKDNNIYCEKKYLSILKEGYPQLCDPQMKVSEN